MWHFDRTANRIRDFLIQFAVLGLYFLPTLFLIRFATKWLTPKQVSQSLADNNLTFIADGLELTAMNFFLVVPGTIAHCSESNLNSLKDKLQALNERRQFNPTPELFVARSNLQGEINNIEWCRANPRQIFFINFGLLNFSFFTAQAALIKFVVPAATTQIAPYAASAALLNATYDKVYLPMLALYKSFPTQEEFESRERRKRMKESLGALGALAREHQRNKLN